MSKRKLPMNEAERERFNDNQTIKKIRQDIREHIKVSDKPVPSSLRMKLKELKFKRKYLGMYNRALEIGKIPWV